MLTDLKVKKLKPGDKPIKVSDERGLYLYVTPAGGKLWRYDYRLDGKRKTLSIGQYPDISLSAARERLAEARTLVANGIDPGIEKRRGAAQKKSTVDALAREWFEENAANKSEKHRRRMWTIIVRDLPMIGAVNIADLKAEQIERALKDAATRSVEMAHRMGTVLRGIYTIAIRRGLVDSSPMPAMVGVLPTVKYEHMAAPTDPDTVGALMRAIDGYDGQFITKCALQLAPRLFLRPGELRKLEWSEVDIKRQRLEIPPEKMKMAEPLVVPLATQCVTILEQIKPLTGHGRYVFPSLRSNDRPMSDNTVNAALRRMGFSKEEITGHGFRAMARTMLDEVLRFAPDAIEAQLAHRVPDRLGRAYNRTRHLDERVRMMQEWADYLDRLKTVTR